MGLEEEFANSKNALLVTYGIHGRRKIL